MKRSASRVVVAVFAILVAGLSFLAYYKKEDISKWAYLRSYQPSAEIAAIAKSVNFTDYGEDIFYYADPDIQDKDEFNKSCQFADKSLVLGCYTSGDNRIYILNIEEPKLTGVEEVTAAHEMLHAAYDDLPSSEKNRVDSLLNVQYQSLDDERIKDLVEEYKKSDPEEAKNELHSILGTEVKELSPQLEEYYAKYFDNRQSVVAQNEAYREVFVSLEKKASTIKSRLQTLQERIEGYEAKLTALDPQITAKLEEVNSYADSGDADKYYPALAQYEALRTDYNSTVVLLNTDIKTYNSLVDEFNALAVQQSDLMHSLDSKYDEKVEQ